LAYSSQAKLSLYNTKVPGLNVTSRHGPGRVGLTFSKFSLGKSHMP